MTFADGRVGRVYARHNQACGHPLAARMIEQGARPGLLVTVCWACKIEKPDNRRKRENR